MDIAVLKDMGLVASYRDYLDLPWRVVQDAMMLAEGRALHQKREEARPRGHRR